MGDDLPPVVSSKLTQKELDALIEKVADIVNWLDDGGAFSQSGDLKTVQTLLESLVIPKKPNDERPPKPNDSVNSFAQRVMGQLHKKRVGTIGSGLPRPDLRPVDSGNHSDRWTTRHGLSRLNLFAREAIRAGRGRAREKAFFIEERRKHYAFLNQYAFFPLANIGLMWNHNVGITEQLKVWFITRTDVHIHLYWKEPRDILANLGMDDGEKHLAVDLPNYMDELIDLIEEVDRYNERAKEPVTSVEATRKLEEQRDELVRKADTLTSQMNQLVYRVTANRYETVCECCPK